jgi:GTP-binding protein
VANKLDDPRLVLETPQLFKLGFGEPVSVSAEHGLGINELLERMEAAMGQFASDAPPEPVMKLAIVGKRNAGKSSFINALAGQQRVIVSETAGTTRDSVDVNVELEGRHFTVIDTAGIRKKASMAGDIEFYGYHRAMRSIRRADVVLLMIDASVPISQVDKNLAAEIVKLYKPVVMVVNKWDLAGEDLAGEDYQDYFDKMLPMLSFAPISLTSATENLNIRQTIELAEQLFDQASTRVGTAELNKALEEIMAQRGPSHKGGSKRPRLYYGAQIATAPPTIVCFVNDVRSFDNSYQRYLLNQLRERLPIAEVPVRLVFRPRRREEAGRG